MLLVVSVYALVKRRFDRTILASLIGCAAAVVPAAWFFGFLAIAYPASIESTTPSATVRLPTNEPIKVAWGGDTLNVNYHAIVPDQRWAYDLFVAPYLTGSENLENYGCYDVPVLAPATGTVASSHDGDPDVVPGRPSMNLKAPFGNHVVIQLPTGTYLVIAHLQEGSVVVTSGEWLEEGRPIGAAVTPGTRVSLISTSIISDRTRRRTRSTSPRGCPCSSEITTVLRCRRVASDTETASSWPREWQCDTRTVEAALGEVLAAIHPEGCPYSS